MADDPTATSSAGDRGGDLHDYPTIDPTSFDVLICGTGLPESVLAAACAAAGKTVLHVDPNPFYGSLYSSLPLPSLPSFLSPSPPSTAAAASSGSHTVVDLHRRSIYSEVETSGAAPERSRRFTVDLVGPRVLYCADEAVDLLLRSGGSHHVEFKSVEGGSLLYWEGCLYPVPDSRQAIFKDATLKLKEKNVLFRFFKLVQAHIAASSSGDEALEGDASAKITEEDLDLPFIEYLKKQQLSPKMRAVVLYAIAMADYDQDGADSCEKLLTTREGIQTIALYSSSIGRFANAEGAFIYPMYGHGELPQAFCRCAAVKGALYVLRMPVAALLMDEVEDKKHFVGARLASGQDILCQQLILDPSYKIPTLDMPCDGSDSNLPRKVARGICIISKSVKQDSSNVLVVFPPKSLEEQQVAAVRVLQLSSNLAVCPPGMFMAYLSSPCADASAGKQCIEKAIHVLFSHQASDGSEGHLETTSENNEDVKPTLIWSCVYVQEITQGTSSSLLSCPMPDENLDYRNILESTKKLFADICPNEEFLPRKSAPVYADDDSDSGE
ncbi:rab escort protein 1-like [Phragmites australis]|uniref:rab escort protein 1-like n=1 Tax=Phragmites australis TaxID=29695 RepID=UPI002D788FA6|nr:rab escort protein 1-like [Phragmites australis]XP_062208304.1 rab escort protein 1-like [Phragmites australis]XP_062208309.1 rab escort protein 1-like [Phragmites australis]XP_062208316.1 rab escort protein 1-like [Phragmites australis]